MFQYISLPVIVLCLITQSTKAALLPSPCPSVFAYEGEPEWDRWYGVLTISSDIGRVSLNYKIQLDHPAHLLVSWDGEVFTDDNINFSVLDLNHLQRAGEIVKSRIMVKFNPLGTIPSVSKVIINGNTMCLGDGNGNVHNGAVTEAPYNRPDPSFSEEEPISLYNRPQTNNQDHGNSNNKHNYNEPSYNNAGSNYPDIPTYSNAASSQAGTNYATSNSAGYNNPSYSNTASNSNSNYANNANSLPDVVYPSNHHSSSQSQWSENQQTNTGTNNNNNNNNNNNRNNTAQAVNNGPLVTTLTLPNVTQSKNNIDTIVQIIKNQLEQQQGSTSSNNTVIVALVSPVNTNSAQQPHSNSYQAQQTHSSSYQTQSRDRDGADTSTVRTTTTPTTTPSNIPVKVRNTTPTSVSKNSNTRNKD